MVMGKSIAEMADDVIAMMKGDGQELDMAVFRVAGSYSVTTRRHVRRLVIEKSLEQAKEAP